MRGFQLTGLPVLMAATLGIAFIATRTSLWIGLILFLGFVILPLGYIVYVYYLGMALAMRGQLDDAIQHYTRVLRLPGNKFRTYIRRAALKNAVGDIEGAIADYSAAMHCSPAEDPALYGIRSALYLGERDYVHALADSDRLLELRPGSEIGYANRAAARMFLDDIEGAINDCNKGLEQNGSPSGTALLYNNRGTAYRLSGEFNEAMANYNLAMSTRLSESEKIMIHPSIATNQGILYYLQGDYDNARIYFQQANNINPSFYKALVSLALARFKLGQQTAASQLWSDVLKKEPRYEDEAFLRRDLNLPVEMMGDVTALVESIAV